MSGWSNLSDARLKKNIHTIDNAMEKVKNLRGICFEWIYSIDFERGRQIGFIAQELEKTLPEVVSKKNGRFTMKYAEINALLVEAIKEQQQQIEGQKKEIESLKSDHDQLQELKFQVAELKIMLKK
jgi:hypothetical protein